MTTQSVRLHTLHQVAAEQQPRRVRNSNGLRPWVLFVIVVIAAFFGLTYSRISLDRSAFLLETLEEQIANEHVRQSALRVELAELRDPQRIARAAGELGLVFPSSRVELAVERVSRHELDADYRWAQLKAYVNAQP